MDVYPLTCAARSNQTAITQGGLEQTLKPGVIVKLLNRNLSAVLVAGCALGLVSGVAPATASEEKTSAFDTIGRVAPEVFEDTAAKENQRSSDVVSPLELTADPSVPIVLGEGQARIEVSLPFGDVASTSQGESDYPLFDNGNGSVTVPVGKNDGSVQIVTVLEDSSAPESYAYDLGLPEGAKLDQSEEGFITILSSDDSLIGGIAAPWAKDSNGVEVPTHYEVDGATVTQVVEHRDAAVSYPIVADPYMGRNLISQAWVSSAPQGSVVNVVPTAWGRQYSGQTVFSYHWSELQIRVQSQYLSSSVREQFYCHVYGNIFEPDTYNMETWRPYQDWGTQLNLWDRCNPT
jgi:hypothetical protein